MMLEDIEHSYINDIISENAFKKEFCHLKGKPIGYDFSHLLQE